MVQIRGPDDPANSGWSRFADGTEVVVTAHVTKEGTLQEDAPGSVRQRIEVETEQIIKGDENFVVNCGLRINIYQQQSKGGLDRRQAPPPFDCFATENGCDFPPRFLLRVTTATRAHLTTRAICQKTESSLWPLPNLRASKYFPASRAAVWNSGVRESIAASSKRFTPCGRHTKPR